MPKPQRNTTCSTINEECTSNEVKKILDSTTKALLHDNEHNFNAKLRVIHPHISVKKIMPNVEYSFDYGITSLTSLTFIH